MNPENAQLELSLLRRTLDEFPACVFVVSEDQRLRYLNASCNAFFKELFGETAGEGAEFPGLLQESSRQEWFERCAAAFERGSLEFEQTMDRSDDGPERVFEVRMRAVECSDLGRCLITIFREVTQRRERERSLERARQDLESLAKVRDTVLSIIAHDLRSPIAQLNSLVYLLREAGESITPQKLGVYADELENSTRHLFAALENLLQWSSSRRRNLDPVPEWFDTAERVKTSVGLYRDEAERKGVSIDLRLLPDASIESDPEMFAFIVRNLVANAIKFTPRDGFIELREQVKGDDYILTVADTGVGMEAEQIRTIFDPNRHFSTRGTQGEKGIGLGLKLCLEFSRKMGGELNTDSRPNEGTRMTLRLPVSTGA